MQEHEIFDFQILRLTDKFYKKFIECIHEISLTAVGLLGEGGGTITHAKQVKKNKKMYLVKYYLYISLILYKNRFSKV